MSLLESLLLNQFAMFTLVLARIGGLIMVAPIFGTQAAPAQIRAFLAVALALLITPLFSSNPPADMNNLIIYGKYLANEALVGLLLGFGMTIFLSGIQLTGQVVSQLGGTALAEVFDSNANQNVSVYSQAFYFLTLVMFVLLDGHRLLLEGLLNTYAWSPPGKVVLGETYVEALTTVLGQSFELGLRAGAPAITALLLSTLVLGLIGRTLPQINILAVGFSVNSLLTLGSLFASIGVIAWTFPLQIVGVIELLSDAVRQAAAPS